MNILVFLTDYIQLRSQHTGAPFTEYRIKFRTFHRSNVICPFPHYVDFKLMHSLISVYVCPFSEFFSLLIVCALPKNKDYIS